MQDALESDRHFSLYSHLCHTPFLNTLLTPLYLSNIVSNYFPTETHTSSVKTGSMLYCFLFHMLFVPQFLWFWNPIHPSRFSRGTAALRMASPITLALWFSTRVAPTLWSCIPKNLLGSRGDRCLVAGMTREGYGQLYGQGPEMVNILQCTV